MDSLDSFLEWVGGKATSVLDYLKTKDMSEAQIADARAREAQATATGQIANSGALGVPVDVQKIALMAAIGFVGWKLLK